MNIVTDFVCAGCQRPLEDPESARVLPGRVPQAVKTIHDDCFLAATTASVWRAGPFDTVRVWRARGYDIESRGRGLATLVFEDKVAS